MMMRLTLILGAVVVTTSCGEWPPRSEQIATHLQVHRAAMDELYAAFMETQYYSMSYIADEGIHVDPHPQSVSLVGSGWLVGPEAERFRDLMVSADVFSIDRTADYAWTDMFVRARGAYYTILLVRDEPISEHWKICESEFALLDCGYCDVDLGEPWRMKYTWYSTRMSYGESILCNLADSASSRDD